jgi:hypothetical protein
MGHAEDRAALRSTAIPDSVQKMKGEQSRAEGPEHRYFIGGSDARIIMGDDEEALWRERRGEVEPARLILLTPLLP